MVAPAFRWPPGCGQPGARKEAPPSEKFFTPPRHGRSPGATPASSLTSLRVKRLIQGAGGSLSDDAGLNRAVLVAGVLAGVTEHGRVGAAGGAALAAGGGAGAHGHLQHHLGAAVG